MIFFETSLMIVIGWARSVNIVIKSELVIWFAFGWHRKIGSFIFNSQSIILVFMWTRSTLDRLKIPSTHWSFLPFSNVRNRVISPGSWVGLKLFIQVPLLTNSWHISRMMEWFFDNIVSGARIPWIRSYIIIGLLWGRPLIVQVGVDLKP